MILWIATLLLILFGCTSRQPAEPFSFIVVSDIHFVRQEDYSTYNGLSDLVRSNIRRSETTFIPFMKELKIHAETFLPRPVTIFSCGDIVQGSSVIPSVHFQNFIRDYNSVGIPIPLFNANGNHEMVAAGMEEAYDSYFLPFMSRQTGKEINTRHFSLDFGNSHFVVIDGLPPNRKSGDDGQSWDLLDEQWFWLEADLESNKDKDHIFIFSHAPIWPVKNNKVMYGYDQKKHRAFVDLLLKYNVRVFFAGHEHVNSLVVYKDEGKQLIQMIPNSAIRLIDETSPSTPIREYTLQNVNPGERYHWQVLRYKDNIRYFKKTNGLSGYFLVTVDGPQICVKMYRAFKKGQIEEHKISFDPLTGATKFQSYQP